MTYTYDGIAGGKHAVTNLSDGTTFTYDDNGNMMTMQKSPDLTQYFYDSENHLTQVKKNGQIVENYQYDGDGGRTKKIPYGSTPSTKFVGQMYDEQGIRDTVYVFLGDQRIASITNGAVLYFHADHLGSANLVTSPTGTIKELTEYEPYGKFSKREKYGAASEEAWYYFTNQYLDEATDLYYYGARYYSPLIGKFITPDTIVQSPGNPQTFNRYSYCGNNPINRIDPSGHSWGNFLKAVGIAIIGTALTVLSGGTLAPVIGAYWAGVVTGAVAGATIGGTFAAATGGNIGMGLLTGGIGGAIFGGIGGLHLQGTAQVGAHFAGGAASGAINGAITGGDIGVSALTGGLSAGVSEWAGSNVNLFKLTGKYITDVVKQAALGGIVGGTTASAFGGKFQSGFINGAEMSAIGYTSNDWVHSVKNFWNEIIVGDSHQNQMAWEGFSRQMSLDWKVIAVGANLYGYARGFEFVFGNNFRLAPWGNRTGNEYGELPHYHRRIADPETGETINGGGIGWHRPWEKGW